MKNMRILFQICENLIKFLFKFAKHSDGSVCSSSSGILAVHIEGVM